MNRTKQKIRLTVETYRQQLVISRKPSNSNSRCSVMRLLDIFNNPDICCIQRQISSTRQPIEKIRCEI